jgi:hypothetical protein
MRADRSHQAHKLTASRRKTKSSMASTFSTRRGARSRSRRFILVSLDVKALIVVLFALTLSCHTAVATPSESRGLGLLTNYYHDCPARRGPQADYVRSVIKHALRGDHAAMRSIIMHNGPFSSGDNEGYSEVPQALLRTLGDNRYAAFVISQKTSRGSSILGSGTLSHRTSLLPCHTNAFIAFSLFHAEDSTAAQSLDWSNCARECLCWRRVPLTT